MIEDYSPDLVKRAKKITLLVLDVDGVLTDGKIVYGNYGDEIKNYGVNDGLGILLAKRAGLKCIILTAKASRVVTKRAKELGIDRVYQDYHYKIEALKDIRKRFRVEDDQICFIGDDIIDIPVLKRVGLAVCPPNALEYVKPFVHMITKNTGGNGAVREVCDFIVQAQGKWEDITKSYFE